MKKYILLASLLAVVACDTSDEYKTPMFFGLFGPMEWPEQHWQGQNYRPMMTDYQNELPAASQKDKSLFDDVTGLSPEEFIQHLKDADIIRRVYNEKDGLFDEKETGTVIVEVAPNFYGLSSMDQDVIADLISRSYQKETYLVKDTRTQKTVGVITETGLDLF